MLPHRLPGMADIVIVEVNENLPQVRGGYDECIHISDVDYIVEGEHEPFVNMEALEPTEIDRQIAKYLIPHIVDGATLQLGIGSMPNALGEIIAKSDLKDLGMAYGTLFRCISANVFSREINKQAEKTGTRKRRIWMCHWFQRTV